MLMLKAGSVNEFKWKRSNCCGLFSIYCRVLSSSLNKGLKVIKRPTGKNGQSYSSDDRKYGYRLGIDIKDKVSDEGNN